MVISFLFPSSLLLRLPRVASLGAPPPPSTSASSWAAASTWAHQSTAVSFRIFSVPSKLSPLLDLDLFLGFHVRAVFVACSYLFSDLEWICESLLRLVVVFKHPPVVSHLSPYISRTYPLNGSLLFLPYSSEYFLFLWARGRSAAVIRSCETCFCIPSYP